MEFNNWNGKTFSSVIRDFAEFIDTVKEIYYKDKDIEAEMLRKQNDLLHDLELESLKYHDIAKIGKELRSLRRNRRDYKNEYILTESIKDFYKELDGQRFIDKLLSLAERLDKDANIIENQYYTKRSTINNLIHLKKNSEDEKDKQNEDLIQLNRVLKKYCLNLDSAIKGLDKDGINIIEAKMQLEDKFTLNKGKQFISNLSSNIEKFYKPGLKNVSCKSITSDMLLTDKFLKNTLTGKIHISIDDDVVYMLHITIREGKNFKNDKKNKKRRK